VLIGKSQLKKNEPSEAIKIFKKALDAISMYKKEGDPMYKQLFSLEKEIARLYAESAHSLKLIKEKEKKRARAMFAGGEEKRDIDRKSSTTTPNGVDPSAGASSSIPTENVSSKSVEINDSTESPGTSPIHNPPKKKVSFADGKVPGEEYDDDEEDSFFSEHVEALFILAGIGLGCLLVNLAFRKKS
jgi:hypothetical protein